LTCRYLYDTVTGRSIQISDVKLLAIVKKLKGKISLEFVCVKTITHCSAFLVRILLSVSKISTVLSTFTSCTKVGIGRQIFCSQLSRGEKEKNDCRFDK